MNMWNYYGQGGFELAFSQEKLIQKLKHTLVSEKALPIGVESFEKIIKDNYYYVDKTGLIADLLISRAEVTLFIRPRRFGKSLNMSMLKNFFDLKTDKNLFEGLKISENKDMCDKYLGKYPVISVTLKDVSGCH